jgi:hypothetical protein
VCTVLYGGHYCPEKSESLSEQKSSKSIVFTLLQALLTNSYLVQIRTRRKHIDDKQLLAQAHALHINLLPILPLIFETRYQITLVTVTLYARDLDLFKNLGWRILGSVVTFYLAYCKLVQLE